MYPQGSGQAVDNINTLLGRRAGVLELVFRLLPLMDLKNVVLVCHLWREAGEPVLWARGDLGVYKENILSVVEALGDNGRLQSVRNIYVWPSGLSEDLLQAVAGHRGLRSVVLVSCDMSAVLPELLARAVIGLEEVDMKYSRLTTQQVEAVLTAVCEGGSLLKTLNMERTDLSSVDSVLLASAVTSLEQVAFRQTDLTPQQAKDILMTICEGDSQLKTLTIVGANFSLVEEGLLKKAVNSLENVNLLGTKLTQQQIDEILTAVSSGSSRLKKLTLAVNNLSSVAAGLLASAVTSLGQVDLWQTELTQEQTKEIFTAICSGGSRLKSLHIGSNAVQFNPESGMTNLSSVDAELLARAVTSLVEVNLENTELTQEQSEAVFAAIIERDSQLEKLDMRGNNLSLVEPSILGRAVNNLEEVNLGYCQLSQQQAEAILTESLVKTSLRKLDMSGCRLAGPDVLDEDLVARTRLAIRYVTV